MTVNKSILAAIESAGEAEPTNTALRLHLASLLFEDAQFVESLKQAQTVLAQDSINTAALRKAANAAEKLGDLGKAESDRCVLVALGEKTKSAAAAEKPKPLYTPKFSSNDDWADVLTNEGSDKIPLKEGDDGEEEKDFLFETETPETKLSDVAGMEAVKRRLHLAFLAPLQNPEMMKLYGKSLRGGLMLYGAPGGAKFRITRVA
jgi:SpoVK/Ycf46/Vps4 family AAA+-type ATPase